MQTNFAVRPLDSDVRLGFQRFRVSKLPIALAAAGLFALGSLGAAQAAVIDPAAVGTEYLEDTVQSDTYKYSGLTAGDAYDLRVEDFFDGFDGDTLFEVFSDSGLANLVGSITLGDISDPTLVHHFTGSLPTSFLGVVVSAVQCCEGYSVRLDVRPQAVPEPASAALLAIGLVGAFVARRRKRS